MVHHAVHLRRGMWRSNTRIRFLAGAPGRSGSAGGALRPSREGAAVCIPSDTSKFQWSNPQSGQYASVVQFPSPVGTLPLPRAWVYVDASFNGKAFRFIGTHLESVVPSIRQAQGGELRAGPASTSLPVILAMDSNAQAMPLPRDPTYLDFIAAGYNDAWTEIFPLVPGFTCCQAQFDNNPVSQLYQRIDLI